MPRKNSIVTRLVSVIVFFSVVIFAAALGYNYERSRAMLQQELESNARSLALSLVNRVEIQLKAVSKVAEGVARALETGNYSEEALHALLRTTVENNPEVYGASISFEPFAFSPKTRLYAPYYYRKNGKIAYDRLERSYQQVPYLFWDWYQIPRELGSPEWSEPYYDEGAGNVLMTTYSAPFYREANGSQRLRGIVSADIALDALTDLIASVKILKTGYTAVLSRNGMILAHPLKDAIMNETFFSIAEARNDPALRSLGQKMIRGESGFVHYTSLVGITSWMYYAPIPSAGWTLAVVFPEAELLENIGKLSMTMAAIGLVGIVLLMLAVVLIARAIIGPLQSLTEATGRIASGNFDALLPKVNSHDEVGQLTRDFQAMQTSLKAYIKNLTETTAAKERIQSELKVATQIQASLLPRLFPPFPDHSEFDIYASMVPAKEVGGDFYDFFFVDEKNLCFLIADVSDKGVPAALYMMVAKTLLKTEGQRLGEPDKILFSVNNILAADNENCMFTTVFCAILDITTGEVRFANAGHNPPLIADARGVRYLAPKPGLMLGALADTVFVTERLTLDQDGVLFLYTDGVTEAKSSEERLYGEERLLKALQSAPRQPVADMIRYISADVAGHVHGASQSDDITMLAVKMAKKKPAQPDQ
ncbi:SpoIIE family protein phosphatase [Methylomicrobium album]|uniref:HAMP domain-containing protein,cache domain-containing protein n=1 Tax=Methylomicrobium album BG8 TaxID=686340 RepID=H8GKF8_METAL|nr:SpoIIE family protein phosphatase [Methylomicrobium album]EIC30449.1 HAMP domain-containing protein,cache domain-containing protein [Methylomicrobium album BG8]